MPAGRDGITADPATISSYGGNVVSSSDVYNTEINDIYTTIDTLKNAWTGGSATAYINAVKTHETPLKSLGSTIKGVGEGLQEIANLYSTNESDQADASKKFQM